MKQLIELYRQWRGCEPAETRQLAGAGSNRVYYRMTDSEGQSVVGCVGTSTDENRAFVSLSRHFAERQLPVPQVLAVSDDGLRYLQTDLGGTSLFDALRSGRNLGGHYSAAELTLLHRTIWLLPAIQFKGAEDLDYSCCYPQPAFDAEGVHFDLNYFKYCFLKATGLDFHEVRLEADFRRLAADLTSDDDAVMGFLYRDFQARNVMLVGSDGKGGGEPHFIDFQGGRRGPLYYDLASFLWQASANYGDALRYDLLHTYYEAAQTYTQMPPWSAFAARLQLFVLFRTMQVLGAYGYRGYFERKPHFIASIPAAIGNLRQLLSDNRFPYPYLTDVLQRLTALPQFEQAEQVKLPAGDSNQQAGQGDQPATDSQLVVRVFSFSYKKGIPEDESGNGGGYVFDCRGTHNPGRYDPYKQLTGLDEPVIRFLEGNGEILTFLESVYRLADAHVERYMQRGFTSLMFAFGCTGGQHRSVYCAQHLAEHLHKKYGIEVRICHREQQIRTILK